MFSNNNHILSAIFSIWSDWKSVIDYANHHNGSCTFGSFNNAVICFY